jgi:hypothetical protein
MRAGSSYKRLLHVAAIGSRKAKSGTVTGAGGRVAQGRMRSNAVVGILPDTDYGLCLLERVENLLS